MQFLYRPVKRDTLIQNRVRVATTLFRTTRVYRHCAGFLLCYLMAVAAAAEPSTEFSIVSQAVTDHFNSVPGHQAGDLISQSQIAAALEVVKQAGWADVKAKEIVQLGLADNSFLVREFSTPAGRKFMRKAARHAGAYTRLDRLSSIARGETIVRGLIRDKGGDKFIEYLATTKGGHNLGATLAGARGGADLNKPTSRIYTADDLVAVLKREIDEAAL